MRRGLLACLVVLCTLVAAPVALAAKTDFNSSKLRRAVTIDGMLEHLTAFQEIADANGGNRASGLPGYDESVDYVAGELRAAGYRVTRQAFEIPFFRELAPAELERVSPDPRVYAEDETGTFTYSGDGEVTAPLQAVDTARADSGCEAADFAGFTAGNVALVKRGTCTFQVKAENAEAAGADAVIIYNDGADAGRMGVIVGTLGEPSVTIPVVGMSFADGQELVGLLGSGPVTMRVETETESDIRTTENVLAETARGRSDRTVVVGAHLDSEGDTPALNDNGSGSAAVLEIAEHMARPGIPPRNKVVFAFFGAEELGLLGSEYYVENLKRQGRLGDVALNLNYDMIASRNGVRFVYDGDGSEEIADAGPAGSGLMEQTFVDYFRSEGLASDSSGLTGSSDYAPFMAEGIPVGGLFAGAGDAKTEEQAAIFGGTAGIPYDECYHTPCDRLEGLNLDLLDEMADAAAHAVFTFARTKEDVGTATRVKPGKQGGTRASKTAAGRGFGVKHGAPRKRR